MSSVSIFVSFYVESFENMLFVVSISTVDFDKSICLNKIFYVSSAKLLLLLSCCVIVGETVID